MIGKLKKLIPRNIKRKVNLLLHRGSKYTCPFCNYSSKDLSLIGLDLPVLKKRHVVGAGRRFGGCYKCGSTDRERLVYIILKERFNILSGNKEKAILHIAPERLVSNKLLDFGFKNYICGDLFTEGYRYPDHVKNINILHIPYSDNTFDLVICNHVLEHIPNDMDAMKELQRVLRPGGKAILQVPISKNSLKTFEDFSINDPKEREKVFGQFDHVRIYGQDYVDRLAGSGFMVNRINISKEYANFGLNPEEDVFIGEK